MRATYYITSSTLVTIEGSIGYLQSLTTGNRVEFTRPAEKPCSVVISTLANPGYATGNGYEVKCAIGHILVKQPVVDSTRCWTFYNDKLGVVKTFQVGLEDSVTLDENKFVLVQGKVVTVYDQNLKKLLKCAFIAYNSIELDGLYVILVNTKGRTRLHVCDIIGMAGKVATAGQAVMCYQHGAGYVVEAVDEYTSSVRETYRRIRTYCQ